MADKYFSDWDSLVGAVEKVIPSVLTNDVAPLAENILRKHIKNDIYNAYTPKTNGWVTANGTPTTYQRRHVLESAIMSSMMSPDTLFITSTATASPAILNGYSFHNRYPGAFLQLLESGNMGLWHSGFARPAVKNTQDEIDSSSAITGAIRKGFKRETGIYLDLI